MRKVISRVRAIVGLVWQRLRGSKISTGSVLGDAAAVMAILGVTAIGLMGPQALDNPEPALQTGAPEPFVVQPLLSQPRYETGNSGIRAFSFRTPRGSAVPALIEPSARHDIPRVDVAFRPKVTPPWAEERVLSPLLPARFSPCRDGPQLDLREDRVAGVVGSRSVVVWFGGVRITTFPLEVTKTCFVKEVLFEPRSSETAVEVLVVRKRIEQ